MKIFNREINNDDMTNIASYMNDEIREDLHSKFAPCSHEKFISEYLKEDPEFIDILVSEFEFTE